MKNLSLQEQLLKSGLVNASQMKAAKSEKQKQAKQQQHNKTVIADEAKERAQKARLDQAEKDRELNQQRQEEEARKQLAAQVNQLIEQHRLPKEKWRPDQIDDSLAYHFTHNNKVKTFYASQTMREQIVQGQLAIVKLGKQYEVIPAEIALKIKTRDEQRVIVFNEKVISEQPQDDPYAEFQIPDDLVW